MHAYMYVLPNKYAKLAYAQERQNLSDQGEVRSGATIRKLGE